MGGAQSSSSSAFNASDRREQHLPHVPLSSKALAQATPVLATSTSYRDNNRSSIFQYVFGDSSIRSLCEDAPPPPPPLPPGSSPPPPPPPSSDNKEIDSIEAASKLVSAYPNPGPYEQAMMMSGKPLVSLDTYDGFRCEISKQLSPFMAVFHSFWLGTSMIPDGRKSNYTFMTQVADENGLLMTRVDPARGAFDGRIHRALLGGLAMGKIQMGVSTNESEGGQNDQLLAELDFGGQTWTGNLKYGSMGGAIVYGLNYFQSITPKLAMGGEGMYIAANQNLLSSYMARYNFDARENGDDDIIDPALNKAAGGNALGSERPGASTLCMNFNAAQGALSMNYKRCVTPNRVTLGAELQCTLFALDQSNVLLGAEFKLQRSKVAFCLDGEGRIQTVVEAKLGMAPGSPTLNFSADVNHFKDQMRFGYGINIEG